MFKGMSGVLAQIDLWIGRIEASILSLAIIAMATNSIANVFGRYVFSQSLYFTDELNQFLIVIITFMGLGYITRKGKHIRMSAFYDMWPAKVQKVSMIVIALLTAVVMFTLAWYALEYVQKLERRGRVTPALQVPLYLTYIWVSLGFFIAGIQYLLTAIRNTDLSDDTVFISYTTIDTYDDPEITSAIQHCQTDIETDSEASDGTMVESNLNKKQEPKP
ncbi:C4-dicarboxylate ABC transporter substrate-binding protein [Endozoicomonas sp. OPT23]|uniref:TRAP transporter small permease n=1 Tax=Endozoicomonas sp. OPT23 TaxID=2072845 RepID=UPI00129BBF25|nr:TRAP transporter small permease [Endozoicomonas sp. OPT23]MRI35270.1 C4-dicarboxylate ABC transporter substrate-binding protein [Endozoicomonas sp. OPT23]